MKDEMSMMEESYANSADELQDQSDSMLPNISGRFSKQALNGLVASFNKALEAAGFPGDYPTFDGNQTTLPMEFVRGLMMMSDAAEETGSGVVSRWIASPMIEALSLLQANSTRWQSRKPLRRR